MNFNNSKISNFIEQQLPSFVVEEFPKFVEFFTSYYKSLEDEGGILDISNNILEYLDLDNLRKSDLVRRTKLTENLSSSSTTIEVESVVGFPKENGLVAINDEIIFYENANLSENKFENCKRGYTATTELLELGTTVKNSVAAAHSENAEVKNISNLFLFAIITNCEEQYLQGFPYTETVSDVDLITLIKNIKDFYSYKGTKVSIEFLFRILFNEEILVRYPKEFLIKASESNWTVDDIIKVSAISGDPYDLVGQEIYQSELSYQAEPVIVNNIVEYSAGDRKIYEIRLNVLEQPQFNIPSETFLTKNINSSQKNIFVDSTIGFPEENGIIQVNDEIIQYKFKSFNQFFDCVRGSQGTVAVTHPISSKVYTPEYLYGYKNGIVDPNNLIKMRLIGMLTSTIIEDGSSYYDDRDIIELSENGIVDDSPQFQNWIINETGIVGSSSDVEINSKVNLYTTNVNSVYKTSNYAYIATNGIPEHPIGPFIGTPKNIGNQYLLKNIPLSTTRATTVEPVGNKTVGLFLNGVEAFSCISASSEIFGEIISVNITNSGYEFQDGISPSFRLIGGGGTGAVFSGKVINGTLNSITVVNGGSNFTSTPELQIAYGFDARADIINDNDIISGSIRTITVVSGGTQYTVPPDVVITDNTGRGKGAYAVATISGGTVVGIDVLNGGIDYSDKDNVVVTLVSKGKDCVANVTVRKWNYDRVFRLENNRNSATGAWTSTTTRKYDRLNGYLFDSLDVSKGLQYGYALNPKGIRSLLSDNLQGASSDYSENASNFTHSPILGWSYDGAPIYGPYGFSDSLDSNSNITRLRSSYRLKSTISANRPSVSIYPLGAFIEDYEYVYGLGDLDEHNGRFCFTPEYPDGVYAYFITVNSSGKGIFPYILGTSFKYSPSVSNFDILHIQREENLPDDARRLRTSKTPNSGFDIRLYVNSVIRGSIDSYFVGDSSSTFKVGDFVYTDNKDTEGSGTVATIESLYGTTVSSLTYSVVSGFTASGITVTSGLTQFAYPTSITCQGITIPYESYITTTEPHNLSNDDFVLINPKHNNVVSKTYKVRISDFQVINYNSPTTTTQLAQDILYNTTTIFVDDVSGFSVNDYILINQEILKINSINSGNESFNVSRGQLDTTVRLHNTDNNVSIYIPENEFDYDLEVGDGLTSSTGSGTVYSIDKQNKTIEIRVLSGEFTNSNIILDGSLPAKEIDISSVTAKKSYWEIDVSNTGNNYVRDINFDLFKGTRYIFDLSDSSNLNTNFTFSEDIQNYNEISTITLSGVPGTTGCILEIDEDLFNTVNVSRLYYFEKNGKVLDNDTYFSVKDNYFSGLKKVQVVNDNTFKFPIDGQLESDSYFGIEYTTTSKTAVGKINSILNVDGGFGFKKLPEVIGVTHTEIDSAKFSFTISNGSITNVFVIREGSRYSENTIITVSTDTGINAEFLPVITNGRITSVSVLNGGSGYSITDTILAVDTSAQILPSSSSIGKIKTIKFADYGNQIVKDRTLAKQLLFYTNVLVSNVTGNFFYRIGEFLNTPSTRVSLLSYKKVAPQSYLLKVKTVYGKLNINDTLTGAINGTTSIVREIKNPKIFAKVGSLIEKKGYYESDLGKLSSSSQRLTDSYYYQDYSYVIRSTKSLNDYRQQVNKSVHPLGFKLFGEVAVEGGGSITNSGLTGNGSVTLPEDYSDLTVVVIVASGLTVESTVKQVRNTVTILNKKNLSSIDGIGSALLDFTANDVEIDRLNSISNLFNSQTKTFQISSVDGSDINGDTGALVLIDGVFQEPSESKNINSISYIGNVATITTDGDHGYAYTLSGLTYPYDLYVDISNVTYSGTGFNFNDRFEVYEVDSSNTFKVLFDNPDSYLSNTDVNACADVQSTIDNLIGILNYKILNPSSSLPTVNFGGWTASGVSTVVSANKHKDASNLITLNRTEIIDSSFSVISGFTGNPDPVKCKRDIGYIVDAVVLDLFNGGNNNIIDAANAYVSISGNTYVPNTIDGEVNETVTAFNEARDLMKLAITNQLSNKDLTILPDYITTSGTISSSFLTNAKLDKGQFIIDGSNIIFTEPPKLGSDFYSILYKFRDVQDDQRYSYKVKDILFDGSTTTYNLYKNDGTALLTEPDENLLVFLDGVLQFYGESYTIDRSIVPNKIVFTFAPEKERSFFAYSFGKYKYLDNITSQINGNSDTFELFYESSTIKITNVNQLLVILDGVLQKINESYTINENILTFKETPVAGKQCKLIYFYGKTFEKTISIYNGKVYEPIIDIGTTTPEGCQVLFRDQKAYDYLKPGDKIKIEGESAKEIISIRSSAVKYSDNLEYLTFIYNDTQPIRGRNAVAEAVVSSGKVIDVNILNPGVDYDVAPIVIFKNTCDNPGSGAKAEAIVKNGQVIDINMLSTGSGYTSEPEILFAKKYEIIKNQYPIYNFTERSVNISHTINPPFSIWSDITLYDVTFPSGVLPFDSSYVPTVIVTVNGLTPHYTVIRNLTPSGHTIQTSETNRFIDLHVVPVITEASLINVSKEIDVIIPTSIASTEITVDKEIVLDKDSGVIDDVYDYNNLYTNSPGALNPKLGLRLKNFDENKFKYEPFEVNGNYDIGSSMTIEAITRYMPNLTIDLVTNRSNSVKGDLNDPEYNFGLEAYVSFGLTLASDISPTSANILVSGSTTYLPTISGYIQFGDELVQYSTISGSTLLNCDRGALNTTATSHLAGTYIRNAWRG